MEKALRILTDEEIDAMPDASMREAAYALSDAQWDEIHRNKAAFVSLCDTYRGTKFIYGHEMEDDNNQRYYDLGEEMYDSGLQNAIDTISENPECEVVCGDITIFENAFYWDIALGSAEGFRCSGHITIVA